MRTRWLLLGVVLLALAGAVLFWPHSAAQSISPHILEGAQFGDGMKEKPLKIVEPIACDSCSRTDNGLTIATDRNTYSGSKFYVYMNITSRYKEATATDIELDFINDTGASVVSIEERRTETITFDDWARLCSYSDGEKLENGTQLTIADCNDINTPYEKNIEGWYSVGDIATEKSEPLMKSSNMFYTEAQPLAAEAGEIKMIRVLVSVPLGTRGKFSIVTSDGSVLDPWWDNTYLYRKQINITAASTLPSGYTANITWNMTDPHVLLADGNDTRVVIDTGTPIETDRNITSVGSATAVLEFKLQSEIAAGGYNDSYWVYYGNSGAGAGPNDKSKVYYSYDDFEGYVNASTPANWTASLGTYIATNDIKIGTMGGYWTGGNQAPNNYALVYSTKPITPHNYSVSFKIYVPTWAGDHIGISTNTNISGTTTYHDACRFTDSSGGSYCYKQIGGTFQDYSGGPTLTTGSWHDIGAYVYADGNEGDYFFDNTLWHSWDSTWNSGGDRYAGLSGGYNTIKTYFDNYMVKLLSPANPAYSLGAEELMTPIKTIRYSGAANTSAGYVWTVNVTWKGDSERYNYSAIEANFSGAPFNYTNFSVNIIDANTTTIGYSTTLSPAAYYWKSYANTSTGVWNTTPQYPFTNNGASGITLTAVPGWGIVEGANAVITCAAGAGTGLTPVLKLDGVIVSNTYSAVLSAGTYSFTCSITTPFWLPASVTNTLTVGVTGTGCTNSSTFAYTGTVVPSAKINWIDISAQYSAHIVRPDVNDVYSPNANITKFYNSTNAYILAANNSLGNITLNYGNYYANLGVLNDSNAPNLTTQTPNVTQLSQYIYTFTDMNEMTAVPGRPPSTTNLYYTLFCPGGSTYVSINDTAAAVQTIAAFSPLDRAELDVRYSATDFYYRDLLITSPVESRVFYWIDATTVTAIKTTFTIYDNSGLFSNASLYVKKQINNNMVSMTEGVLDNSNSISAYLIDGQEYYITVTSGANTRIIGLLYADASSLLRSLIIGASTQPEPGNYTYTVKQNNATGAITMTWIDPNNNTVNASMWIYNNTNLSQLLYYGSSAAQNLEIVYAADINGSYKVVTSVNNTQLGMVSNTNFFGQALEVFKEMKGNIEELFGAEGAKLCLAFVVATFLLLLAMSFGSIYSKMAVIIVAVLASFFSYIGWFPISGGLAAIIILLAVMNKLSDKRAENL